jgi:hypothetical protein
MSTAQPPAKISMDDLVRHAVRQASDQVPSDVAARVAEMVPAFDRALANLPPAPLNAVIFHLTLPEENRYIKYTDISADHGAIDYVAVLKHAFAMTRGFNPASRIIYITGLSDDCSFVPPDVTIVRLPLKPAWLMYDRVVAVNAYMQSSAFNANTVFLDSDAFPNWPLDRVFRLNFDVGVTYRGGGLMPLNEGVIFSAHRPGLAARRFFTRYLASYEALCRDDFVIGIYKDIRRWRGGQLSLNSCATAVGVMNEVTPRQISGAVVQYLNCDDYNFSVRTGESYSTAQLQRKYILHLKGPIKSGVDGLAAFQRTWLQQVMQGAIGT